MYIRWENVSRCKSDTDSSIAMPSFVGLRLHAAGGGVNGFFIFCSVMLFNNKVCGCYFAMKLLDIETVSISLYREFL